ncbi:hypothetical protein E2562_011635 [Oryza meyeriana var. granulata]|uniref:Protein kinase domain-containing protein n=1 Tax=Oryza meyeriana var. granulata TaxID=110450 RepID=A0A6G1DWL3_9ORYZ|nr:hypothetical protein E2562_011635 [Oryza meyeriana var. granulata]
MDSARPVGGTPAFMAPEVARGEEQGPAADVWALGCTVIEMATGRPPWSDMVDVLAAVHRIGYTDAVPEVPAWLSAEAKDFLASCFARNASDRSTAAQLLEHPFVAFSCREVKAAQPKPRWVSPKSTLDAAFWESETDDEEEVDEITESLCDRIKSLACSVLALPDWDSDEGWIDLLGDQCEACDSEVTKESVDVARSAPSKVSSAATVRAADVVVVGGGCCPSDEIEAEDQPYGGDILAADRSIERRNKTKTSALGEKPATTSGDGAGVDHLSSGKKEAVPAPFARDPHDSDWPGCPPSRAQHRPHPRTAPRALSRSALTPDGFGVQHLHSLLAAMVRACVDVTRGVCAAPT